MQRCRHSIGLRIRRLHRGPSGGYDPPSGLWWPV